MKEKEFRCKAEVDASYEVPEREEVRKPRTFREKWENYWYHYKGRTLLIAFLAVAFGFTLWQYLSREKPDYIVMMAFDKTVSSDIVDGVEEYLAPYGEDINGDGKVIVSVYDVSTSSNTEIQRSNATKIMAELQNGEIMLFLVDDVYFDKLHGLEVFEQNERFPDRDGYAYCLRDTPLADALNEVQTNFISHNFYIAKRVVAGTSFEKVEKSVKSEQESLALLDRFLDAMESESKE